MLPVAAALGSGLRWAAEAHRHYVRLAAALCMSSRGGFSAARAAMTRCARGRLAQRLRAGRAVVAMGVGRKRSGERRMTAATLLQR